MTSPAATRDDDPETLRGRQTKSIRSPATTRSRRSITTTPRIRAVSAYPRGTVTLLAEDWRTLEIQLNQGMQDPSSRRELDLNGRQVTLQVRRPDRPKTVIR